MIKTHKEKSITSKFKLRQNYNLAKRKCEEAKIVIGSKNNLRMLTFLIIKN